MGKNFALSFFQWHNTYVDIYVYAVGLAPSLCISDTAGPAVRAHVN